MTRSAVVRPAVSAWNMLLYRGDTKSFLNLTGTTREAFYKLDSILFIEEAVGRKRGRPPILDNSGRLGLNLFWVGSAMQTKYLCMIFGVVPSSANIIIDNLRSLICRRLQANDRLQIAWPNGVKMEEWARFITAYYQNGHVDECFTMSYTVVIFTRLLIGHIIGRGERTGILAEADPCYCRNAEASDSFI